MYAAPPAVVPAAGSARRGGLAAGPLLAVCCLIFILFLIAATIVLALIPVYLPNKGTSLSVDSAPYYFTMTPEQPLTGPDGDLDAEARTELGKKIDKAQGFPEGSTNVENIAVRTPATRRKRRTFGLNRNRRQTSARILIVRARFRRGACGACQIVVSVFSFEFSFVFNGARVTLTVVAVASATIPNVSTLAPVTGEVTTTTTTVAPGETTTASTASTSGSTTATTGSSSGSTTATTGSSSGSTTATTGSSGESTTAVSTTEAVTPNLVI